MKGLILASVVLMSASAFANSWECTVEPGRRLKDLGNGDGNPKKIRIQFLKGKSFYLKLDLDGLARDCSFDTQSISRYQCFNEYEWGSFVETGYLDFYQKDSNKKEAMAYYTPGKMVRNKVAYDKSSTRTFFCEKVK